MAKFYITDFFRWEQPLINQLRKEEKYVYGLRSADTGTGFSIEHRVYVNNIGFMITDEPLPLIDDSFLNDDDFYQLGWEEDCTLKDTTVDISNEIESAKEEVMRRQKEWEEIRKLQKGAGA